MYSKRKNSESAADRKAEQIKKLNEIEADLIIALEKTNADEKKRLENIKHDTEITDAAYRRSINTLRDRAHKLSKSESWRDRSIAKTIENVEIPLMEEKIMDNLDNQTMSTLRAMDDSGYIREGLYKSLYGISAKKCKLLES